MTVVFLPTSAIDRLNALKKVFLHYTSHPLGDPSRPVSQKLVFFVCAKMDEYVTRGTRLKFFSWLTGRKIKTSDMSQEYSLTEVEARALVYMFHPVKEGTQWIIENPTVFEDRMACVALVFTSAQKRSIK